MLVAIGENYQLQKYDLKENSAFEFEDAPSITFFGKPANKLDKKKYRIMQGVEGTEESIYIIATNLPKEVKPNDRIKFLDTFYTVQSVGYYFENNNLVNAKIFSTEYIMKHCPKGIVLA